MITLLGHEAADLARLILQYQDALFERDVVTTEEIDGEITTIYSIEKLTDAPGNFQHISELMDRIGEIYERAKARDKITEQLSK